MQRIVRYITKCKQVGLFQAVRSVQAHFMHQAFDKKWRVQALQKKANHTWHAIQTHHAGISFTIFFDQLKKMFTTFPCNEFFLDFKNEFIIEKAEEAQQHIFDILGSGPIKMQKIAWHHDFRLKAQSPAEGYAFNSELYYKDIHLKAHDGQTLGKDIKVPWELSRFHHFIFLGKAHQLISDEKYVAAFTHQFSNWIDENPFLLGVNWVCPMEVALRAINWIWAFYCFKDAPISDEIWEKFVCSLYDHYIYIENTWEFYDGRTSNHYLSDLVGYLYLCYFFSGLSGTVSKTEYCYKRILSEMKRQVFAEGTSYEGSTQYHRLVTELFFHAFVVLQALGFSVPAWFTERLKNMCLFIDWCSPRPGVLVSLGDYDSSVVLFGGLSEHVIQKYKKSESDSIKHYPLFGLSSMKRDDWHVTLRHHAYTKRQPPGHFHNDAASITLAYKGIPILVDPGSYVYMSSVYWRNYFRSVNVHNTFFINGDEPIPLNNCLFGLDIPEKQVLLDGGLHTVHTLYKRFGLTAHRSLVFEEAEKKFHITDWWEGMELFDEHKLTKWNFTFSSMINIVQENNAWIIFVENKPLVRFTSPHIHFALERGWISLQYGKKEACWVLQAEAPCAVYEKNSIFIESI